MTSVVVFAGPTIRADEIGAVLDCAILPPARQGDIWRAVIAHAPKAIGLIDGVFLDVPAVWHREILWAMSRGVHVFGAASMGALRAAELAAYGMRGVGRIYQAFRDGRWPGFDEPFENDDEVAIVHAPDAAGGAALSDAMVDLRDTLLAAESAGLVGRQERDALAREMQRLHFPQRSFAALALAADAVLGSVRARHLQAWLPDGRVARKNLDAIDLLRTISAFIDGKPAPLVPEFTFQRALVWETFVGTATPADPREDIVLDELRLDPAEWRAARRAAAGRLRLLATAPAPPQGSDRAAFERIRRSTGLATRRQIDVWLAANALDAAGFNRLMREEATLEAAADAANPTDVAVAILDHLRLTGRFTQLLRQADEKRSVSGPVPPAGPELGAALDWFATTHPAHDTKGGINEQARAAGWDNANVYLRAVWREYLFHHRRPAPEPTPDGTN